MTEKVKTISFVSCAAVISVVALIALLATRPGSLREFAKVGQPFYSDFSNPDAATKLEVASLRLDGTLQNFVVQKQDGVWRIPSHHNYPVDATERLAETATAFIGLLRQSVADRRENKHEDFGVLDPKSEKAEEILDPSRAGKRITLIGANDEVLLDLIIGDKVKREEKAAGANATSGSSQVGDSFFYVRRPDETETYRAEIDIDLSTRFSDWIDTDLLSLGDERITRILLDRYEFKEQAFRTPGGIEIQNVTIPGEKILLRREDNSKDWELEGFDEPGKELDTFKVSSLAEHFKDLVIKGVRPKLTFQGEQVLTADLQLKLPQQLIQNSPQQAQAIVEQLQGELLEKGFEIAHNPERNALSLASKRGELVASAETGVVYTLNFGEAFVGDEEAIQIGGTKKDKAKNDNDVSAEKKSEDIQATPVADRNRYLMVRVEFDESLFGATPEEPQEPVEPIKPDGFDEWLTEKIKSTEITEDEGDQTEVDSTGSDIPEAPSEIQDEAKEREAIYVKYEADRDVYLNDKNTFEDRKEKYQEARREFRRKIRDGRKKVEELNARFGEWYYVISDQSFENLQVSRADLIRETPDAEGDKFELPDNIPPGLTPRLPERPEIDFELNDEAQNQGEAESGSEHAKKTEDENEKEPKNNSGEENVDTNDNKDQTEGKSPQNTEAESAKQSGSNSQ